MGLQTDQYNSSSQKPFIYIGWDVGGWNCDRNTKSRDALVILDQSRSVIGKSWRGNLRDAINEAYDSHQFIEALFRLCEAGEPPVECQYIIGIDTPLGFSDAFRSLVNSMMPVDGIWQSHTNPYLFRRTEQFLFETGLKPLSAIKDMIGSQSTKGIHVLAKFAPNIITTGTWSDGNQLTAIEAYPAACKYSETIRELLLPFMVFLNNYDEPVKTIWDGAVFTDDIVDEDQRDALLCALIAWVYKNKPEKLAQPEDDVSLTEGWIFVPVDALTNITTRC